METRTPSSQGKRTAGEPARRFDGGARIRVAVLGAGAMGRRHSRVFSHESGFALVGVYDVHPERARTAADLLGTRALLHEEEALDAAELVVVATPICAHAGAVRRALGAGRSVLVEKPICARAREAVELCRVAERTGAGLWVAHSERFNPVVVALRARVTGPEIVSLEIRRMAPPPRRAAPHGVLTDLGVHDLDLVAMLTGGACTVVEARCSRADGSEPGPERGADSASVRLQTSTGAIAGLFASRAATMRVRSLVLRTPDALYRGDLLEFALVRVCAATGREERVPLDLVEPLVLQARHLRSALAGAPSSCASGWDGARAVALAEEAEKLSVPRSSWYAQRYGSMG